MKIVCISSSQVPSDTANSIQALKVCQAFAQLGHETTLLVPGMRADGANETSLMKHYGLEQSFRIEWLGGGSRRWFPWKAVRRAQLLGVERLYCWPLQSAVLGLLAGKTVLVELHDLPSGRFGPLWLRLFLVLPGRKRLLPITTALRDALHLPERLSVVAPDGVDLERYNSLPDAQNPRRALDLPEAPTVLCTGHLYPGRGTDLFLSLAGRFPQTSFVWVGGRPEDVCTWKEQAEGQTLKNVCFTGFVPNEKIPLYQAAGDILLMPYGTVVTTSSGGDTSQVTSPMKMFEYMAAGRAIVASDLPVLHEVLDAQTAIFCPSGDVEAWDAALSKLLGNEAERLKLGINTRLAVAPYAWKERCKKVLEGLR